MSLRTFLRREYACIKDDAGLELAFVKLNRAEEKFKWKYKGKEKAYNIKRNDIYNFKIRGIFFHKVIYFYNVHNPNPLGFNKSSNNFEPIISPDLYNRMMENEILIKLNTLSGSKINWKMVLLAIAVILVLGYIGYQYGLFGNHQAIVNTTMNVTNNSSFSGNFTKVGTNLTGLYK